MVEIIDKEKQDKRQRKLNRFNQHGGLNARQLTGFRDRCKGN